MYVQPREKQPSNGCKKQRRERYMHAFLYFIILSIKLKARVYFIMTMTST